MNKVTNDNTFVPLLSEIKSKEDNAVEIPSPI
jgi:hypothetical protein